MVTTVCASVLLLGRYCVERFAMLMMDACEATTAMCWVGFLIGVCVCDVSRLLRTAILFMKSVVTAELAETVHQPLLQLADISCCTCIGTTTALDTGQAWRSSLAWRSVGVLTLSSAFTDFFPTLRVLSFDRAAFALMLTLSIASFTPPPEDGADI